MTLKKFLNDPKAFFVVLILALLFFVGVLLGALGMLLVVHDLIPEPVYTNLPVKNTSSNSANTSNSTNTTSSTNSTTSNTTNSTTSSVTLPTVSTSGWKTYTNTNNGYTVKYPANWVVKKVTNAGLDDTTCDQTSFTSPTGNITMFGLRKVGSKTNLTCRTGIGGGTPRFIANTTILSTTTKMQAYDSGKGMMDEVFWSKKTNDVEIIAAADGIHEFYADFSSKDVADFYHMSTALKQDLATAKAIFESVQYVK